MTLRQQIASGPRFVIDRYPGIDDGGGKVRAGLPIMSDCGACDARGAFVDRETGLCSMCWRVWRFRLQVAAASESAPRHYHLGYGLESGGMERTACGIHTASANVMHTWDDVDCPRCLCKKLDGAP